MYELPEDVKMLQELAMDFALREILPQGGTLRRIR